MEGVPVFEPSALTDFVGTDIPTPRFAVRDVWPEGGSGIIAGRPKDGKSTLAVELAVSLWSGTPMFGLERFEVQARGQTGDGRPDHSRVLYVQQENSTQRVQHDLYRILEARGLGRFVVDEHHSAEDLRAAGIPASEDITLQHFELFDQEYIETVSSSRLDILSQEGVDLSRKEHQAALASLIESNDYHYVFLDPLYMTIGAVDEKDSKELKPVLQYLSSLRDHFGCGVILTHHMTDKAGANEASRLLGSTYIHAWYEAAIMVRREGKTFDVKVDVVRSHGEELEHTLTGRGVGQWHYDPEAQGREDTLGRRAPGSARKQANIGLLATLKQEHPDWTTAQLAAELGVSEKTLGRYEHELEQREAAATAAAFTNGGDGLADRVWPDD